MAEITRRKPKVSNPVTIGTPKDAGLEDDNKGTPQSALKWVFLTIMIIAIPLSLFYYTSVNAASYGYAGSPAILAAIVAVVSVHIVLILFVILAWKA